MVLPVQGDETLISDGAKIKSDPECLGHRSGRPVLTDRVSPVRPLKLDPVSFFKKRSSTANLCPFTSG